MRDAVTPIVIIIVLALALGGCATSPTTTTGVVDCTKVNNFCDWGTLFLVGVQSGSLLAGQYATAVQASVVAASTALDLLKDGCAAAAGGSITADDVTRLMAQVMDEIAKINAVGALIKG